MSESEVQDKDGSWYSSVAEYLFQGVLGGCGCGHGPRIAIDMLSLFCDIAADAAGRSEKIYADHYREVMAHWLDGAGLTEHGTGIGNSWLTAKGDEIYAEIRRMEKEKQP